MEAFKREMKQTKAKAENTENSRIATLPPPHFCMDFTSNRAADSFFVSPAFDAHTRIFYFDLKILPCQVQQVKCSIPDRNLNLTETISHTHKKLIPFISLGNKKTVPTITDKN